MAHPAYSPLEQAVADLFNVLYYYSPHTWNGGATVYKGIPCLQNPLDLWILQETIQETKPTMLIETGSACGATAAYLSDLFPELRIFSIDTQKEMQPFPAASKRDHVEFVKGMSTDKQIVARIRKLANAKGQRVMVMLDSDHTTGNVLKEMEIYGPLVTKGCYMVVEDTNIDSAPVNHPAFVDNGPMKAVAQYLKKHAAEWTVDRGKEKFYVSFYPCGWLLRK